MKLRKSIVFITIATVNLISCGHSNDKVQVSNEDINSLAKDLGIKEGEPRVKVLSPQSPNPTLSKGSTVIINLDKPAAQPFVTVFQPGPAKSQGSPASPGSKTFNTKTYASANKGVSR